MNSRPKDKLSEVEEYLARARRKPKPVPVSYRVILGRMGWIELSRTDTSYEGLFDLIVTEQFLESCPPPIQIYLEERGCKSSADVIEHAAQCLDAHGTTLDTILRRPADKTLSSATALTAYSEPTGQCCLFCDYQHATNKRRKAKQMSVPERRERLIRAGACFWCLELRHRAADCPAKRPRCERCPGPHHFLLCERATSRTVNAAQAGAAVPDPSLRMRR